MFVGITATAVGTFTAARGAMSAFETQCAALDYAIERWVKIETATSFIFNDDLQNLRFYTKSERRTWQAFEELIMRLGAQYCQDHGVRLVVSTERFAQDAKMLLGEYAPLAQGGALVGLINNIATCMLRYVGRDLSWLQDPATVNVQVWLKDQLTLEDHQVILNAVGLIALVEGR